jgi:membrane protein YqaA with SNARE-associated domain
MFKTYRIILQSAFLVAVIGIAFYLAKIASDSPVLREIVSDYGYIGIFVIALVSGFNIFVPIPAASFMPLFLESGLSFWLTTIVITLGMTTADSLSFILARAGKHLFSESWGEKLFERFRGLEEKYYRYPLAVIFIFAAVAPLPNEVLLVPTAFFLRYRLRQLVPVLLAGNLIFTILFAEGLLSIFEELF